jgi:subfamily B ATP-binding cassette protein MsbA
MHNIFKEISKKEWKNDVYTMWCLMRKHLGRLIIAVVCSLLLASVNGAIAWLVKDVLDNLVVEKNQTFLMFLPVGVFALFFLRGSFAFANNFLMNSIGAKIVRALRKSLYERLLGLPLSFHSDKSSGSVISRLMNDVTVLESQIPYTSKNFFVQSTTVIILAFVALYRKWDLALLAFTVIPLVVVVSDKFGKRMKKTSSKTRQLISNVTKIVHETLSGIKIIKSYTMEKEMARKNDEAVSAHYRNFMREVRINEFTSAFMEIIAGTGIAVLLWYGFYLIVNDKLSVSQFLSFVIAVMMMYDPLKRLSRVNNNFQMIRAALHRIKDIYKLEPEKSGKRVRDVVEGRIKYESVTFKYTDSVEPVLSNINLEVLPGEIVAVVGYSGAGKSTLVDLILGFWSNYSGSILIDDTDLRQFDLQSLRSHIGVVSQDIFLFDDTVRNNILYGNPDASDDDIATAAQAAYAHEFIMETPDGYDTFIGERGVKLSGGQKQRISLARAIVKNPEILILDEATSSLDTDSETKIQKALEGILPGRTTVVIAHRLSTIKKADRIIVLDKGKIIQQGRHDDLFRDGGLYKDLYNMQFGMSSS